MPVDTARIIEVLSTLAENEKMQVTVTQCTRAGLITAAGATAGAVLGGPGGAVLGSVLSSGIAAATSKKFQSVVEILASMESEKKESLADEVREIMKRLEISDVTALKEKMRNSASVKQDVKDKLINYLKNEMQMEVMNT